MDTPEDLSQLSDEDLFSEFRELFTIGRNSTHPDGLVGDQRKRYQAICAEMRVRKWIPKKGRRYGLDEKDYARVAHQD